VVADHGVSFRKKATFAPPFTVGQLGFRREISEAKFPDIANLPLLVKLPRQRRGRVDERYARTIDVLPTIADALDVQLPFDVDGARCSSGGRRA
jgi:arylsulfatase A-like enzyme